MTELTVRELRDALAKKAIELGEKACAAKAEKMAMIDEAVKAKSPMPNNYWLPAHTAQARFDNCIFLLEALDEALRN